MHPNMMEWQLESRFKFHVSYQGGIQLGGERMISLIIILLDLVAAVHLGPEGHTGTRKFAACAQTDMMPPRH